MRSTSASLATAWILIGTAVSVAQPPAPLAPFERQSTPLPGATVRDRELPAPAVVVAPRRPAVSPAQTLIHERAAEQARLRDARLESKKWAGYSPSRPPVRHGHHSADLNAYLHTPYFWGGYYTPVFPY